MRYYRLSYAKAGTSTFTPIDTTLSDYRASIVTPPHNFHPHVLGPQLAGRPPGCTRCGTANTTPGSKRAWRRRPHGIWDTTQAELDEGAYILRLEMFDAAGNPLPTVQYQDHAGNGTGLRLPSHPSSPGTTTSGLPGQQAADVRSTPASNECGVIAWPPPIR